MKRIIIFIIVFNHSFLGYSQNEDIDFIRQNKIKSIRIVNSADSSTSIYEYNSAGFLLKKTNPAPVSNVCIETTTYFYKDTLLVKKGWLLKSDKTSYYDNTDTTLYQYDSLGRLEYVFSGIKGNDHTNETLEEYTYYEAGSFNNRNQVYQKSFYWTDPRKYCGKPYAISFNDRQLFLRDFEIYQYGYSDPKKPIASTSYRVCSEENKDKNNMQIFCPDESTSLIEISDTLNLNFNYTLGTSEILDDETEVGNNKVLSKSFSRQKLNKVTIQKIKNGKTYQIIEKKFDRDPFTSNTDIEYDIRGLKQKSKTLIQLTDLKKKQEFTLLYFYEFYKQ